MKKSIQIPGWYWGKNQDSNTLIRTVDQIDYNIIKVVFYKINENGNPLINDKKVKSINKSKIGRKLTEEEFKKYEIEDVEGLDFGYYNKPTIF